MGFFDDIKWGFQQVFNPDAKTLRKQAVDQVIKPIPGVGAIVEAVDQIDKAKQRAGAEIIAEGDKVQDAIVDTVKSAWDYLKLPLVIIGGFGILVLINQIRR